MRQLLFVCAVALALPAAAAARPVRSAIFFYPWYSNMRHDGGWAHWQQDGHAPPGDIASAFYPVRGPYSSGDARTLRQQMHDIAAAGARTTVSAASATTVFTFTLLGGMDLRPRAEQSNGGCLSMHRDPSKTRRVWRNREPAAERMGRAQDQPRSPRAAAS